MATIRWFNPNTTSRVVQLTQTADELTIHSGPTVAQLAFREKIGPLPAEELLKEREKLFDSWRSLGYLPGGLHDLLSRLSRKNPPRTRALAALQLGWRRAADGLAPLCDSLVNPDESLCSILDALGMLGDPSVASAIRPFTTRKLLSRRRSAIEALRNLGDAEGLNEALARTFESLPASVQSAITAADKDGLSAQLLAALVTELQNVPEQTRGLVLDHVYELATPACVAAVRTLIPQWPFARVYLWRYVKSIAKRAMLRGDHATFGLVLYWVERRGRQTAGVRATFKSGLDGVTRSMRIFGRKTQDYLRRAAWRYLTRLARYRPEQYPWAAAEALIPYVPTDAQEPKHPIGEYGECFLLNRILFGGGQRIRKNKVGMAHFESAKFQPAPREESFPELWDAQPRAYLRLLGAAKLPLVHPFAHRALAGPHRAILKQASLDEVTLLLDAPYEPTAALGVEELNRRFNPVHPDWALLERIATDNRERVRTIGHEWLKQTASLWLPEVNRLIRYLFFAYPGTRGLVADLAIPAMTASEQLRANSLAAMLEALRSPEPFPSAHDALARVIREALLAEASERLTVAELLAMILLGSPSAQSVAGVLLAMQPDAVAELGLARLVQLAQHAIGAVRSAGLALVRAAISHFQNDPSLLLILSESEWADTRETAIALLRELDWGRLGIDGLCGLIDSNRPDVQDLGKEMILRHLSELPPTELIHRLSQHPHPNLRAFTLDLVFRHLPAGTQWLSGVLGFLRKILFDLWPARADKDRALQLLLERGLCDGEQAQLAAGLLLEVARSRTRLDHEAALEGLVRLQLAWPDVPMGVRIG